MKRIQYYMHYPRRDRRRYLSDAICVSRVVASLVATQRVRVRVCVWGKKPAGRTGFEIVHTHTRYTYTYGNAHTRMRAPRALTLEFGSYTASRRRYVHDMRTCDDVGPRRICAVVACVFEMCVCVRAC